MLWNKGMLGIKGKVQFVANDDIYDVYRDLITEAKKEIILVTPWFRPPSHFSHHIHNAIKGNIRFVLITRPIEKASSSDFSKKMNETHKNEIEKLMKLNTGKIKIKWGGIFGILGKEEELEKVEVFYVDKLHAKICLADRKSGIISSSNVIESSLMDNIEAGVVFDGRIIYEADDYDIANDVYGFIEWIKESGNSESKITNSCTECGKRILNPHHYLCLSCYKKKNPINSSSKNTHNQTKCPECGGNKKPKFALCYRCEEKKK